MGKIRRGIVAAAILLLGYVHPARSIEPCGDASNALSPCRTAMPSTSDPQALGITMAKVELTPVAAGIRPTVGSDPALGFPGGGPADELLPDSVARVSKKKSKIKDNDRKKKSSVSKAKKKEREKKAKKKVTKKKQKIKKKRVSPH